jgi:hypothetical protein
MVLVQSTNVTNFIPWICLWIKCFNVKGKVEATTITPIFKIHFQNQYKKDYL